jgi:alcohol dehydrogenase, propanol-preferring
MRAMVLSATRTPLEPRDARDPALGPGQVLIEVSACGICRTDLHVVDGELTEPKLPLIPGHQVVGRVLAIGPGVERLTVGERVGVPWLGWTCGECRYCRSGRENLCGSAQFTGYNRDGGYAELCVADHRFCFQIPAGYPDIQAAPLLCAGLIGYRSLRAAGDAERLGLYGFGAAAHIVIQVARHEGRRIFAFTRDADDAAQRFARELGAEWAGDALRHGPEELDAAIIFAVHCPDAGLAGVDPGSVPDGPGVPRSVAAVGCGLPPGPHPATNAIVSRTVRTRRWHRRSTDWRSRGIGSVNSDESSEPVLRCHHPLG